MIQGKEINEGSILSNTITFWREKNNTTIAEMIPRILEETLYIFQWHYQNAGSKAYRDTRDRNVSHIKTTIGLLLNEGQLTLANDVAYALLDTSSLPLSDKIDSNVYSSSTTFEQVPEIKTKDDIDKLFDNRNSTIFTKEKVISSAKKHIKQAFLRGGIKESTYNKDLAKVMEMIFLEWCKQFPLTQAPASMDQNFHPPCFY